MSNFAEGVERMFYTNARIFTSDFTFRHGAFEVREDGTFGQILPETVPADAVDLGGATVIPGLIEVHSHGCMGHDFSDGDYEGLVEMARYFLRCGVTSFAPASMTLPYEDLAKAFANARRLVDEQPEGCSRLRGIQMEGPYFSYSRRGAQNPAYLKNPDIEGFKKLNDDCGGLIRIADLAPDLPGSEEFVREISKICTVSVAHTDATYDQAKAAFDAGATHITHLYNTMNGVHHRNPGPIPAAAENPNVRAELICDGLHVHPASMRLAFAAFGGARMILVSDSGRCAGLPEGTRFMIGGQEAELSGGIGRLLNGTICCSATNMYACLTNCIAWGIREEDAVRAATYNPACALGVEAEVGAIATGKRADFLVCTPDYAGKRVFFGGKEQ